MDIALVIAALVLITCALLLIFYPLWQNATTPTAPSGLSAGPTIDEVAVRYQAQLSAITELMFDYEMGKVSPEEYEPLLTSVKLEAAKTRREMDRLATHNTTDTEIEALIAQTRLTLTTANGPMLPSIDAEIARLKNGPLAVARHEQFTCPHCHTPVDSNQKFCGGCGYKLELSTVAASGVCPQCGYTFAAKDAYCARCGVLLKPKDIIPINVQ